MRRERKAIFLVGMRMLLVNLPLVRETLEFFAQKFRYRCVIRTDFSTRNSEGHHSVLFKHIPDIGFQNITDLWASITSPVGMRSRRTIITNPNSDCTACGAVFWHLVRIVLKIAAAGSPGQSKAHIGTSLLV